MQAIQPTHDPQIDLRSLSKQYASTKSGTTVALSQVTFSVQQGEQIALLGPSGCGKTSTLRLIAGLETPDAGEIWLKGRCVAGKGYWVPPDARQIGMVFQDGALFPHLTIAQNIAFALHSRNNTSQRTAESLLEMVGLAGLGNRYPHQISGGQQQRVALARALASNPQVVLLDEPFSRLDATLRASLRHEVQHILKQANVTAIFVTHDQEEALSLADRLVVMFNGKVAQIGTPVEVYTRPTTADVATFVGEANFFPGCAQGAIVECLFGKLLLATPQEGKVQVMIRPEAIEAIPTRNGLATINRIRYFGHDQVAHLVLKTGEQIRARSLPRPELEVGMQVNLLVRGVVVAYPVT